MSFQKETSLALVKILLIADNERPSGKSFKIMVNSEITLSTDFNNELAISVEKGMFFHSPIFKCN